MIPSGFGTVVVFLLLIAPGLLFDLLEDRRRPTIKESAFRETGRTILASIGLDVGAGLIVALLATRLPDFLVNPVDLASQKASELVDARQGPVVATLVVQTVFACGLAWGLHACLAHRSLTALEAVSLWFKVFRGAPTGTVAYAQIRLTSGATWLGVVEGYSADLATNGRELTLSKPIMAAPPGQKLKPLAPQWERVVLRGDAIEWIAVKYDTPPAPRDDRIPSHEDHGRGL